MVTAMRCAKCGADNREGARFCDKCGAKLSPKCASCGETQQAAVRPDLLNGPFRDVPFPLNEIATQPYYSRNRALRDWLSWAGGHADGGWKQIVL